MLDLSNYLVKYIGGKHGAIKKPELRVDETGSVKFGIGKYTYSHENLSSFSDIVGYYLVEQIGRSWLIEQRSLEVNERHPVGVWDSILEKNPVIQGSRGFTQAFIGATACWLFLGYHLYLISEHAEISKKLVKRLRLIDQFQGARFEITVAAVMITAGFSLKYSPEKGDGKHVEFIATDRATGKKFAVEAKSRHRVGILTKGSSSAPNEPLKARTRNLLVEAIDKDPELPLIVFIDVNLPVSTLEAGDPIERELRETWETLDMSRWQNGFPCVGAFFYNESAPWRLQEHLIPKTLTSWVVNMSRPHRHSIDADPYLQRISSAFNKAFRIPDINWKNPKIGRNV